jgi:hypothetical protein
MYYPDYEAIVKIFKAKKYLTIINKKHILDPLDLTVDCKIIVAVNTEPL